VEKGFNHEEIKVTAKESGIMVAYEEKTFF
jgi:hypothetical protein